MRAIFFNLRWNIKVRQIHFTKFDLKKNLSHQKHPCIKLAKSFTTLANSSVKKSSEIIPNIKFLSLLVLLARF